MRKPKWLRPDNGAFPEGWGRGRVDGVSGHLGESPHGKSMPEKGYESLRTWCPTLRTLRWPPCGQGGCPPVLATALASLTCLFRT